MHRATATAFLLFVVLSLVLTYPLVRNLASAVEDRQDALLNVWITAWDGHQLLSNPLHLFDANIFYPYRGTLAYSELLLGNGLLALPITAASGNPVLGYNLALLLSFALSGLGAYLLVHSLTGRAEAGWIAGAIYAFCAYRMTNLAQAQLLTTQWLPFALLALDRLLHRPRPRHAVLLALFFCLQALSSFYYGILLALACLGLVLWAWLYLPTARVRRTSLHLAAALVGALLVLLPFALPYFQAQQTLGFERALADSEPFSASLRQFAMVPPGSVLYGRWLPSTDQPLAGGYPADALFPGLIAVALGLGGLWRGRRGRRWFWLVLLLAAVILSLGPRLYLAPGQPAGSALRLPYAWLYTLVPGFKAMRAPVRFDALAMLCLAVLAGYGLAALRPESLRRSAALLLMGLVVLESLVWPGARAEPVPTGNQVPPVTRWLAERPVQPLLELPMAFTAGGPQLDYQYLSTYHWHPTPDGYSGFIPAKHGQIRYEMERFPGERSISLLQALGVQRVVIHTDRFPAASRSRMLEALAQAADLAPVQRFGEDLVYQVQPRAFGTGELVVNAYLPARAAAGQPYTAYILATNRGARSYAVPPTARTAPTVTWEGVEGVGVPQEERPGGGDLPLVTSPAGGAMVIPITIAAPTNPGSYQLILGEAAGPLGAWQAVGAIEVGNQGDSAFPVPARLTAWNVPEAAQAGGDLTMGLTWQVLGKIDAYYSYYVKLLDGSGSAVAGWDGQPQGGAAPTLLWVPGQAIEDAVTLSVPADTPPGRYTVAAGLYRAVDLAAALTLDEQGRPLPSLVLGTVEIRP